MSQPSMKQLAVRSNAAHYEALKAFRDDLVGQANWDGDGTVIQTLRGWGCIDTAGITRLGLDLIAAYEQRWRLRRCTCDASDYGSCTCDLTPTEWLAYARTNPLVDQGLTRPNEMPEA